MTNLMIVDDEPMFLEHAKKFMNYYFPDITVTKCFESSTEALHSMQEEIPDIIMTDISMPELDGLAFAKEINEQYPQCVTIIVSSYSSFEYAQQAIQYNVFSYIVKPLDIDIVRPLMEKALNLSISRKLQFADNANFIEENKEIFFTDLLSQLISSKENLKRRYEQLQFPIPFENSYGSIICISFPNPKELANWRYDINRFPTALKNALHLYLGVKTAYFARNVDFNYYFFILGLEHTKQTLPSKDICSHIKSFFNIECTVRLIKTFSSLNEFVAAETPHSVPDHEKTSSNKELIKKAIVYMEKFYDQPITRESVAETIYMSSSYFALQFKKETGQSFLNYLTEIRIKKAMELLETNMKINDIMEAVGYQSRSQFLLNFRNYTSYTPSEYRSNFLNMEERS